jgi:hypothetical protein
VHQSSCGEFVFEIDQQALLQAMQFNGYARCANDKERKKERKLQK